LKTLKMLNFFKVFLFLRHFALKLAFSPYMAFQKQL
jgi:hypothetical protein